MSIRLYWSALFLLLAHNNLRAQTLTPRPITAAQSPDSTRPKPIRIICHTTIKPGNEPLYVVDGLPISTEQLKLLNPADIQEVFVFKSVEATTLYGSRAINGAIIITLKHASELRTREQKRPVK